MTVDNEPACYLRYEEIAVGETRISRPYALSRGEITEYAEKWNPEPFHLQASEARSRGFADVFASGVHLLSIAVKLCNEFRPLPNFIAGLAWDDIRFYCPAYPGDALSVTMGCTGKRRSTKQPGRAVINYEIQLHNQSSECVLSYKTTALADVSDF